VGLKHRWMLKIYRFLPIAVAVFWQWYRPHFASHYTDELCSTWSTTVNLLLASAVISCDSQTLLHVSFLAALFVSAIWHFLSLGHSCGTLFHPPSPITSYCTAVTSSSTENVCVRFDWDFETPAPSDSLILVRCINVLTYLLTLTKEY